MNWQQKLTLRKQFGLLILVVILLFIAVGYALQTKLDSTQQILHELTEQALPSMAEASERAILSTELFLAIEQFTQASNPASRRIADQEVQNKIKETANLVNQVDKGSTEVLKLKSLKDEVAQLTLLIDQKLNLAEQIQERLEHINQLQASSAQLFLGNDNLKNSMLLWQLNFSTIIAKAYQSANSNQLTQLLNLEQDIQLLLDSMQAYAQKHPIYFSNLNTINTQLQQDLLSDQGLIRLRTDYLRVSGRSRGREHFIRNLIDDYSNVNEQIAFNETANLKAEVTELADDLSMQKSWLVGAFMIFVVMIGIILLHYQWVIHRLKRLTEKLSGMSTNHTKQQKSVDEIDELFLAFEDFSNTINIQTQRLESLSLTDSLTSVANRRAFDQRLRETLTHAQVLSILLIDVDYFKQFNDTYGHLKGDEALQKVASSLHQTLSGEACLFARYGGEEFVAILPNHNIADAKNKAQQAIQAIHECQIEHASSQVSDRISISLGLVTRQANQQTDADTLMRFADQALYYSKAQGRNQATHFDDIKAV
ncbi:GGDEF domain-containing protein [Marinomonas sp. THO17]|uniref:GGDEF domain-containing protein n=1 Tax=Marinomonas sp. THO17 TaxID=3149048 RepID=UPI00336BF2FC